MKRILFPFALVALIVGLGLVSAALPARACDPSPTGEPCAPNFIGGFGGFCSMPQFYFNSVAHAASTDEHAASNTWRDRLTALAIGAVFLAGYAAFAAWRTRPPDDRAELRRWRRDHR